MIISKLLIASVCVGVCVSYSVPNVNASFNDSPTPFEIKVDPAFLEETQYKVAHARQPDNTDAFPYTDGPTALNWTAVRDTWLQSYNWSRVESSINNKLQQYTIVVHPQNSSYDEPIPLHYVHHQSPRQDAIPLLFIHGWPGSFLEVMNIIDLLTNPSNSSLPAFHVVAPSIPGFGFSPAPIKPGFGPVAAGDTFDALMNQLGYTKYVGQGGDFGSVILRALAVSHPNSLVSQLNNFWVVQPNATDLNRLTNNQTTPEETAYINTVLGFELNIFGYGHVQSTASLLPAYGTGDSPMGLAMWIFYLMRSGVDPQVYNFPAEEIITWTMMYWIQGPYGGMRFYKEVRADRGFVDYGFGPISGFVPTPVAMSEFPYDAWYGLPLDWARRGGNVLRRYTHTHGGHFAAFEVPNELILDVWDWFGDRELSGTSIFYT